MNRAWLRKSDCIRRSSSLEKHRFSGVLASLRIPPPASLISPLEGCTESGYKGFCLKIEFDGFRLARQIMKI
ncbi:hypothetical protein NL676_032806 [Syzygium grande]|nr:hypothetical protein NL676_032806 [Syzygium grande]